jgi:redox-sensitive bicupin YhaK (pirin superfamily)
VTTVPSRRRLVQRHKGQRHGPITRLFSPGDIGQSIKPFVFLDYVNADRGPGFGFHPHSGIATLTHPLSFDIEHETSSGQIDVVRRGGVEWVEAGNGLWHRARPLSGDRVQGFQLWFALPPARENTEPSTRFIAPEQVPQDGPVLVLLGNYGSARSSITTPVDANVFLVRLSVGQAWDYEPLPSHTVAWAFVQSGETEVNGELLGGELAVFEVGAGTLQWRARTDCTVLVGTAAQHDYPLMLGPHSVHTSTSALTAGLRRIAEIGAQLQREGRLS